MIVKNHFRNIILDRWSQIDLVPDFFEMYDSNLRTITDQKQAYLKTESEWFAIYGRNKYRGYSSFATARATKKYPKTRSMWRSYSAKNEWDSKFNFLI